MESRSNKYYKDDFSNGVILSRSNKNAKLYDDYDNLDNMPSYNNTDEIDMDKLKELVNNTGSKRLVNSNYKENFLDRNNKRELAKTKEYDINKLLERAKYENNKLKEPEDRIIRKSKSILSTLESSDLSTIDIKKACQKYESLNDNKNIEMTREIKYQTRQISVDPLIEQVIPEDNGAFDLLEDLKPTGNTIVTKPVSSETNSKMDDTDTFFKQKNDLEDTSDIDIIKKGQVDNDFFTSSYKFSDSDFMSDDFIENDNSHNILKIILLLLAIVVFAGVIFYFVMTYGLGV